MNLIVFRSRTWPFAPDTFSLVTWAGPFEGSDRVIFDTFIIPDADPDTFEGKRYRVPTREVFPDGTQLDLKAWTGIVRGFVEAAVQAKVDKAWLEKDRSGFPPKIVLDEVDRLELLGLRFRDRGQAGLKAVSEVARDQAVRDFAEGLLGFRRATVEDIPSG